MKRAFTLLLGLALAAAGNADENFTPLLKAQFARYPQMELQDCYKLLVQACLGSEHAVGDAATAQRWLEQELAALGSGPAELLLDPISPEGRVVRVHLRAFAARQGDPAQLAAAFVKTAGHFSGSREKLARAWAQVVALTESGALPFSAAAARAYGQKMADAGYPAVRHSETYRRLYRPAYRVVAREYAAELTFSEETHR